MEGVINKLEQIPINNWEIHGIHITSFRGSIITCFDGKCYRLINENGSFINYVFDVCIYKDDILLEIIEGVKSDILSKIFDEFMVNNIESHLESQRREILFKQKQELNLA